MEGLSIFCPFDSGAQFMISATSVVRSKCGEWLERAPISTLLRGSESLLFENVKLDTGENPYKRQPTPVGQTTTLACVVVIHCVHDSKIAPTPNHGISADARMDITLAVLRHVRD